MATLNSDNYSVDKSSGAIIFKKSPELVEIIQVKQEIKDLNSKIDLLLSYIKGGNLNGQEMD